MIGKISNLKYQISKLIFILYLIFFILNSKFLILNSVFAADSSPSASISGSLLNKINALKLEIASKANELTSSVNKKLQNRMALGTVKDKHDLQIILQKSSGNQTLIINEFTLYQVGSKKGSLKDIEVGDFIIGLGDIDDKDNLSTKKIIKQKKPEVSTTSTMWGQVMKISNNIITIKTKGAKSIDILTSNKTSFANKFGDAKLSEFKIDNFIVATGELISDNFITKFVYLISSESSKMSTK